MMHTALPTERKSESKGSTNYKENILLLKEYLNDPSNLSDEKEPFKKFLFDDNFIYYELDNSPVQLTRNTEEIIKIRVLIKYSMSLTYIRYADQSREMIKIN